MGEVAEAPPRHADSRPSTTRVLKGDLGDAVSNIRWKRIAMAQAFVSLAEGSLVFAFRDESRSCEGASGARARRSASERVQRQPSLAHTQQRLQQAGRCGIEKQSGR